MKILHIISSGGMYGAEAVILNLARTMNDGPHRCLLGVFINSSNPQMELHRRAQQEGIESHLISCKGQVDRSAISGIRALAAQTGADVVHAHGYKADIYAWLALRSTGLPLVSTCHTWYDNDPLVYLYGVADRLVLRRYTRVVAVSEDVRQRLLAARIRSENIAIVKNGIDLRPFSGAAPSIRAELAAEHVPIVGMIGRLAVEKGVDIFLRAAALVLPQCPETVFAVAGDGPDRAGLEALIDRLGIRASVRMLGRREDMPSVYAAFDVMVSASRHEGLPMVVLEGMASRLPLVATPVGEVPALVQDGITGLLVPVENPERTAAAIVDLLRDREKRARLGQAARQLVEDKFSARRMTAEYLDLYQAAQAEAGKGSGGRAQPAAASAGMTK